MYDFFVDWLRPIDKMLEKEPWETRYDEFCQLVDQTMANVYDEDYEVVIDILDHLPDEISDFLENCYTELFFCQNFNDFDDNVVNAYANRFRFRISRDTYAYLKEYVKRPYSVYKIIEKHKDYDIIQDLLLETKPIRVEREDSAENNDIDTIFAKIIPYKEKYYYSILSLKIDENKVLKFCKNLKKDLKKLKLSDYSIIPDEILPDVSVKLNSVLLELFAIAFEGLYDMEKEQISELLSEIDSEPLQLIYLIKNEDKVVKFLNNAKKYHIFVDKEHKEAWNYNTDGDENNLDAGIYIVNDKLVCMTCIDDSLHALNKIFKNNIGDCFDGCLLRYTNDYSKEPDFSKERFNNLYEMYDNLLKQSFTTHIEDLDNMTPKECLDKNPSLFYDWLYDYIKAMEIVTEFNYDYEWFLDELGVDKNRL